MTPRAAAASLTVIALAATTLAQEPQRPTFSSRVELLTVDVSALAEDGTPIEGLSPSDFTVRVDGVARRVVSADFLRLDTGETPAMRAPARISDNTSRAATGRFVVIVVDDASFQAGDEKAAIAAVQRFVQTLRPADRVGLALTSSGAYTPPSTDRERIKTALSRVAGGWDIKPEVVSGQYMGLAEGVDIALGNRNMFVQAVARICQREISSGSGGETDPCINEVETGAQRLLDNIRQNAITRTSNIAALMRALAGVSGQKTLVLVSAGLMLPGDIEPVQHIGALAASANATLHTIYVDNSFAGDVRQQTAQVRRSSDVSASINGLDTLAGMSRGSFQRLVGSGDGIFDRLTREMSAVYRLGVEALPSDLDGVAHRIDVRVTRPGAILRAHRNVVGTRDATAGNAEATLARAVRSSDPETGVPAKLTHFTFPGDGGRVRVVLAGEAAPPAAGTAAAMFHVLDGQGRIADSRRTAALGTDDRLPNAPLLIHADLMLEPGPYAARLAVLDSAGAVGVVEHTFVAALTGAPGLALGDVVFFPGGAPEMLAPRDALPANVPSFTAYVEVTGEAAGDPSVTLELVDKSGAPLMSNDVPLDFDGTPPKAGAKSEFSLARVPGGEYTVVASLWRGDEMVGKSSTPVTIAPRDASVPGGAAAVPAAASAMSAGRYAPMLAPPFERASLLAPAVVAAVDKQVAARTSSPAAREAFTAGLREFEQGRAEEAALRFRAALAADPEFAPALFYLAACYAMGGRDDEAAGAWQTALTIAPDTPAVYVQLADALLRQRRGAHARAFVDEGLGRWPDDLDLQWRGMLADAMEGGAGDAVALASLVAARPDLIEARFLLIATLYDQRAAAQGDERARLGAALRPHAEAYIAAGGSQALIVRRWLASVR